jgi:AcrR family transcriptional regulator
MQEVRRRPGPRSDVDVQALLLDVAEELFSEHGVGGVSVRALTRAAGLAPATVNYHFDTKEGLLVALLERRGVALAARQHELLDRIVATENPPSVRSLVEASVVPYVEILAEDTVGGLRWIKVFTSVVFSQDPIRAEAITATPEIAVRFARLLRQALPHLSRSDLRRRVGIAFYGMLSAMGNVDLPAYGSELDRHGVTPAFVDQLVVFTTNGLLGGEQPGSASPVKEPRS